MSNIIVVKSEFMAPELPHFGGEHMHWWLWLDVSGVPEVTRQTGSTEGEYRDQLGFTVLTDDYSGDYDETLPVIVNLHAGPINWQYNVARHILLGSDINEIFDFGSESYLELMENRSEESNAYAVITEAMNKRMNLDLAQQIYHRLMLNSTFH